MSESALKNEYLLGLAGQETLTDKIIFAAPLDDDGEESLAEVYLRVEDWRDLGSPSEITVTIVPDDQLNG